MNALQSYSSDDESVNEAPVPKSSKSSDPGTNYDDVGMDISEDSDDGAPSNTKEKSSAQAAANGGIAPGTMQHGTSVSTGPSDGLKNQNETKEGQRSSLQERLLGIASGGHKAAQEDRASSVNRRESRTSPSRNRDDRDVNKKSRSKSPKAKSPKSKSPKSKSPRPQSPVRGVKNNHKKRSRSKSREREVARSSQSGRDHSSRGHSGRDQSSQGHSGRSRDSRDSRRSRDDDRKRRDDERRSRRTRSRSRSRERRRSRSRSRDRRSRSRSRERRRRSRSHERKRPMDVRKDAQQKLAALKAANPDLTATELMRRSMEAQVEEVKKQTGITLPSYYNPATMNPMKFAEQERKKKLLWGNKSKPAAEGNPIAGPVPTPGISSLYGSLGVPEQRPAPLMPNTNASFGGMGRGGGTGGIMGNFGGRGIGRGVAGLGGSGSSVGIPGGVGGVGGAAGTGGQVSLWASTKFANDKDGKMAEKFRRLMGVKDGSGGGSEVSTSATRPPVPAAAPPPPSTANKGVDLLQKQETMFTSMERQYEMARLATHTHKGFGLGFTSQSFMPK